MITKINVSTGIFWIEIPETGLRLLCGCPVDTVKHLMRRGLILPVDLGDVMAESGPNAILLSDLALQAGRPCNRTEFPVLQMLYRQGLLLPGHPNNTGARPLLVGSRGEVDAQLEYLFRGNYGLASEAEMMEAGLSAGEAREQMRMKLAFAFGRIVPSTELIDAVYVDDGVAALPGGAAIRRLRTNVFEIAHGGSSVEVDLNLAHGESYECPYQLDSHLLEPKYFAVVHTGDGDGWDMNRPTMGSLIQFQGRNYLIDAGPNVDNSLTALGIGINEIDGIFLTHCHDDHLVGLTSLLRGDSRLACYAAAPVRASVMKKIAAAMRLREAELSELMEVRDLRCGEWNDVEGLEVRPLLSPHPVETTLLQFRVFWEGGYKTYAHLADIASDRVLRGFLAAPASKPGIDGALYERTWSAYRERADVKKIDIGGGLIHGEAADFAHDTSPTLILAHTARRLNEAERSIGSGAPFGTVHVLIEGSWDVFRRRAFSYLRDYYPEVPVHRLRHLLNCRVDVLNPEAVLLRAGDRVRDVCLVLGGSVEMLRGEVSGQLFAGSLIGEAQVLIDGMAEESYRAVGYARVLRIPRDIYVDFVQRSGLYANIVKSQLKRDGLRHAWLFAEGVSCVTLNGVVNAAELTACAAGTVMQPDAEDIIVLRSGSALFGSPPGYQEHLAAGSHFGGVAVTGNAVPKGTQVTFQEDSDYYRLPLARVAGIPAVRWKLIETQRRRYGALMSSFFCIIYDT